MRVGVREESGRLGGAGVCCLTEFGRNIRSPAFKVSLGVTFLNLWCSSCCCCGGSIRTCLRRKSLWTRVLGSWGQQRMTHLRAVVEVEEESWLEEVLTVVVFTGGSVSHLECSVEKWEWRVNDLRVSRTDMSKAVRSDDGRRLTSTNEAALVAACWDHFSYHRFNKLRPSSNGGISFRTPKPMPKSKTFRAFLKMYIWMSNFFNFI